MSANQEYVSPTWSTRWAFVLATAGAAVGLGNVWRFPHLVGEHGGGAFILMYLLFVLAVGIPVIMAEAMLGRAGRRSPINTMRIITSDVGASPLWEFTGWLAAVAGFLILAYFSVVAGWTLAYTVWTASGVFTIATPDGVKTLFNQFISDPERQLAWHTIFMVMTVILTARGVRDGLQLAARKMMPLLFMLLIVLVFFAMQYDGFKPAVRFLFYPDFSRLTWEGVLAAMGHAFFSLGLGTGVVMVYASYLPGKISIATATLTVALIDTMVAVLAGLVVFPILFSYEMESVLGPALIFQTLPVAFGQMPGGALWGTLFFLLLVVAAWTTAIALLEPMVAWVRETADVSRVWAAVVVGAANWLVGVVALLSFNQWAFDFEFLGVTKSNGVFDLLDIVTSYFMLPVGSMLIVVFAGWVVSRQLSQDEFGLKYGLDYQLWRLVIRYVSPVLIAIILAHLLIGEFLHADG